MFDSLGMNTYKSFVEVKEVVDVVKALHERDLLDDLSVLLASCDEEFVMEQIVPYGDSSVTAVNNAITHIFKELSKLSIKEIDSLTIAKKVEITSDSGIDSLLLILFIDPSNNVVAQIPFIESVDGIDYRDIMIRPIHELSGDFAALTSKESMWRWEQVNSFNLINSIEMS